MNQFQCFSFVVNWSLQVDYLRLGKRFSITGINTVNSSYTQLGMDYPFSKHYKAD